MKFDTNKTKASSCTKISSAQCYLMDNAAIPSGAHGWEWPTGNANNHNYDYDGDEEDNNNNNSGMSDIDQAGGRHVMYEPTVVFTPVYASMRQQSSLHSHSDGSTENKRALLSWPGVKDVLFQLEALTLGSSSGSSNEGSNIKEEDRKVPAKEARNDAVTGRYCLRGNRKREATTTTTPTAAAACFAAPEPVASAHYTPASGQPALRRSPRLNPEIAAASTAASAKRRAAGPFGY
jgi:hypothetical protein